MPSNNLIIFLFNFINLFPYSQFIENIKHNETLLTNFRQQKQEFNEFQHLKNKKKLKNILNKY